MAFLDNSGDIILDAVLTDTGRMRLAKGDGSFRITKFALADDEINYSIYDKNNASGSAYYDLEILQTPVLEAFTNNASSVKTKLLSIARKDLLYLPVILPFKPAGNTAMNAGADAYIVLVDSATVTQVNAGNTGGDTGQPTEEGILNGNQPGAWQRWIRCDQGLNTTAISADLNLDPDLIETQYLVEMDNRLGYLYAPENAVQATYSFVDDDQIATYYFTANTDEDFVTDLQAGTEVGSSIPGPRGSKIAFRIGATTATRTSNYFFTQLGSAGTLNINGSSGLIPPNYRYIDSIISVTGVTTGYRVELPIRYVKKI